MGKKVRTLLVNPVIRQDDAPRHVPFGLAQLAAILRDSGYPLQVFDCNAWRPSEDRIKAVLRADDWDVVAIGGLVTSYGFMKRFVKLARQEVPRCTILMGGGCVTPIPRELMGFCPEVDVSVIGEGYGTLPELLDSIPDTKTALRDIKGIAWRAQDGEIVINEARELLETVDELPFPAWEFFPLDIYFKNSSLLLSEESMLSERRLEFACSYGCKYMCSYCFHLGLSGELSIVTTRGGSRDVTIGRQRRVRWHSPEYVVELAVYARDRFGVDFISFLDENFVALDQFTNGKWTDSFETLWRNNDLVPRCIQEGKPHHPNTCKGIHWGTTCHVALAKPERLIRMRSLGCSHLDFGLESFSDDILREAKKGASVRMNEQALAAAEHAGIRAIPNQMFGFPNESFESIYQSLDAWDRLGIRAYPFFATPYPGSEWFSTYKETILEQYDQDFEAFLLDLGDATTLTAVISHNFNGVELLGLRELMLHRQTRKIRAYEKTWDRQRAHLNSIPGARATGNGNSAATHEVS